MMGKYWKSKGSCDQMDCTVMVPPAKYLKDNCTEAHDIEIELCSLYRYWDRDAGNFLVNTGANTRYYCPGERLAYAVPTPSHSKVSKDYTTFDCDNGFVKTATGCAPCPAGHCCLEGTMRLCPEHYYSEGYKAGKYTGDTCTRCITSCDKSGRLPQKCAAGSIHDSKCILCSMCGVWPYSGHNCVEDGKFIESTKPKTICPSPSSS
jgi:hypothetical protein